MVITWLEPELETASALGLTEQECQSVQQEALRLVVLDRSICVAHHLDDGRGACISIFCEQGRAHIVGRCNAAYYILDPDQNVLTVSTRFGRVLKMVKSLGQVNARGGEKYTFSGLRE